MPRGDKAKYSVKQQRKAEAIEASYEARGIPEDEAKARAWATVNKQSGGGEKKGGSGQAKSETAKRADRKDSARRAVATKQGKSPNHGLASTRGSQRGSTSLTTLTRDELLKKAAEQQVRGRSRMRKAELIEALRTCLRSSE